ncbi:MAG: type I DNA topoisomerase [Spirochaetes bacterium]|nr:type I DNA topoisomerase [Spirochaetota bacterium]
MANEQKTLIIVESPTKARTITKYLGTKYIVLSSMGHIIDLPKSRLAVDVENDFCPEYITIRGRAKLLNELKKTASQASQVLLATDPDREGEAISWHLKNALSEKNGNIHRVEFHEITDSAIKEAIANPRNINLNLVNAQQARRILDRIVGYYLSPILWKKVKKGLSAGRVQSVALSIICQREQEIDSFIPTEYWTLDAVLVHQNKQFRASLVSYKGQKDYLKTKALTDEVIAYLQDKTFLVHAVSKKERRRRPMPPYTTSKLQQDAANRLGFTSAKTMMIAQQLYEGVDITGVGPVGLITYMRTDSTRISTQAMNNVRKYIADRFSKEYLPESPNIYANRKDAQDAHEAIRPTDVTRDPDTIKNDLTPDQYKLYRLIWKRFVASQMTPEVSLVTSVIIRAGECEFRTSGSIVLFDGFTIIENEEKSEKDMLPELHEGDMLTVVEFLPEQHFTTPPPRYNDASLVKFLEESGIGRPSTYAPTINTLIKRYYVVRNGRQLVPTPLGKIVNDILTKFFPDLISIGFTSSMEEKLDLIEEAKSEWVSMIKDFYVPFKKTVEHAEKHIEEVKGILDEETPYTCQKCGKPMKKKLGKYGFFLACSAFPQCRNAQPYPLGKCPIEGCTGNVVKRASKRGKPFYSCTQYPHCTFITRDTPAEKDCPRCGSALFVKRKKSEGETVFCLRDGCGYKIDIL